MPEPKPNGVLHIAVTGAAGQIAYSLLPLIASGSIFGSTQRMTLRLLEIPRALDVLNGICMELTDGAYPLVESVLPTADAAAAFSNVDIVIFVGAFPRLAGMERSALLAKNAAIFKAQGVALSENASSNVRAVVVGNPANTNAMVLSRFAERIPPRQITALTRLDHNRAVAQVALQCGVKVDDVQGVCIWGNHSSTQYPDITRATAKGESVFEKMGGEMTLAENFIPLIQKRGAAVISARGSSSAMSAAKGIADHMKSWICGDDKVVSMAVPSDGSYGIEEGVWYSYPVRCIGGGEYEIVTGIEVNDFSKKYMDLSAQELFAERKDAIAMLEES